MKIQVEIVNVGSSAHTCCYNAAFSLLIVLSKTTAVMPFWSICMQNAFFSFNIETFL